MYNFVFHDTEIDRLMLIMTDINTSFHIRNNIWGRFGWRQ
jgi:hypothetical protein